MSKWNGELDVDDADFRKDSFDAWLSWEFLQRSLAGCREELIPSEMGELCGKTTLASRKIAQRALHSARCHA
jgi:hypothetical protein